MAPDNKVFDNIPDKYNLKEIFLPREYSYSYVVDEENNLMATYPSFNDERVWDTMPGIRTYVPDDPAAREINNLKRIFGVSADAFFRKNDFILSSPGTQFLDLVLGIMVKYPAVRLEIDVHSDNLGNAAANQLFCRRNEQKLWSTILQQTG